MKRVRRLFLVCSILFCTNDRCSMPLHTLLTDTIESQGGSTLLVQMLNRLGVCASADTLSRFIQFKVSNCNTSLMKYLQPDTFTFISADNIDFMHSYARVFCGQQKSSWHGTTVQATQPLPSLSLTEAMCDVSLDMAQRISTAPGPSTASSTPVTPLDPSHVGLLDHCPAPGPSTASSAPVIPLDPSHVGLLYCCPAPGPSTASSAPVTPLDPSHVGLLDRCPAPGPSTASSTPVIPLDPSHVGTLDRCPAPGPSTASSAPVTPLDPSHIGLLDRCPAPGPSTASSAPVTPLDPSHVGLLDRCPASGPSTASSTPVIPLDPSHIGTLDRCPAPGPSMASSAPVTPLDPSHVGLLDRCPASGPSMASSTPVIPLNPSHIGTLDRCPAPGPSTASSAPVTPLDPSHIGLLDRCPAPGPSTASSTPVSPLDPSHIGLTMSRTHATSLKRKMRSSPISSPLKLTRSPLPKLQRRLRIGTGGHKQQTKPPVPVLEHRQCIHHISLTVEDFLASATETEVTLELHDDLHTYILCGEAASTTNEPLISIQEFFSLVRTTHTEQSQVVYLEVMDAVADTKDTMMQLLHDLHEQFIVSQNMKWLVLEGDAKQYEIVKFEYGDKLSWLIPYPGDWHMLMNYQSALMKPYYDAGLKALASSAGYPLTAIQNSSQF